MFERNARLATEYVTLRHSVQKFEKQIEILVEETCWYNVSVTNMLRTRQVIRAYVFLQGCPSVAGNFVCMVCCFRSLASGKVEKMASWGLT